MNSNSRIARKLLILFWIICFRGAYFRINRIGDYGKRNLKLSGFFLLFFYVRLLYFLLLFYQAFSTFSVKLVTVTLISIRGIYFSRREPEISNSVECNFRKSLGQFFPQEFFHFLFQVFNSFFNSVSLAYYISFRADWDIETFFLADGCRKRKPDLHTLKYPLVYFKDFGYVEILLKNWPQLIWAK